MIKVEIRLFASLRENREKKYFLEFDEGISILDVVNNLGINEEEINLFLLNGIDGDVNRKLKDNDILSLFPPAGGG